MKLKKLFFNLRPTAVDVIILITLSAALWITSSGMWDLQGPDEGRYVQIAKELLTRDNWFYLTVHGMPYDQKPPLAFWIFAFMLRLNGGEISAWALRLPSVLAASGTVIMTYFMGRYSFGRRSGFIASLMLMTSPLFIKNAPTAELDMLYTVAITGALCAWIIRPAEGHTMSFARLTAFWGCIAAAFFIKGPLAFVIIFTVIAWAAWKRRSWSIARSLRPIAGLVFLVGLIVGWLYLQKNIYGAGFVENQVSGETVRRILNGDHGEPFWYYLPRIFTSIMFPWAFFAVPAAATFFRNRKKIRIDQSGAPYFAWLAFPFLLLCLAHGKRQTYLLPLLPAAAVLLGAYFENSFADKKIRRLTALACALAIAAVGALIVGAGVFAMTQTKIVQTDNIWVSVFGLVLLVLCGLLIMAIAWRLLVGPAQTTRLFYAGILVILVIAWVNFMVIRPAFDPSKSTRVLSNTIDLYLKNRHAGREPEKVIVGAIGDASEAEYHVYGHYRVKRFRKADVLQPGRADMTPDLVVMNFENKQYKKIAQSLVDTGFTNRRRVMISKDDLVLFARPAKSSSVAKNDDFHFFFLGDTGSGKPQIYNVVKQMVRRNALSPVDGVFLLGDNLYEGNFVLQSLRQFFVKPFAPLLSRNIPFYAVLGNHDYNNGRERGEVEFPLFNMAGQRYYSLDFGTGPNSVSVFVCDSQALKSDDKEQLAWLDSAVNSSKSDWKILLLHEPIEASEIHHGDSKTLHRLLQPMLSKLDIVLSGHNHLYERRKLMNGVLYVTTGSGGQLNTEKFPTDDLRVVGYNKLGTFVEMGLKDGSITLTTWNEEGQMIDQCLLTRSAVGSKSVVNPNMKRNKSMGRSLITRGRKSSLGT